MTPGSVPPGSGVNAYGAAAVAERVGIVDRVAAGAGRAGTQVGGRLRAGVVRGTARLQAPGPAGSRRHQQGGGEPLVAADELVAAGPAWPGGRARYPLQRVTVRLAAVSVADHAGRDRLVGPGGPAVPGEPQGAPGCGAAARGNGIGVPSAGRGGDRVTGGGAGAGDVQQPQPARHLPLRTRAIADHASRQRQPGDVNGKRSFGPVSPGIVRHHNGVRPGDRVAGGRGRAGDPVQRRPSRAGLVVPGAAAVRGGQQGPGVADREAVRRGQAPDVVQGAGGAAALRVPARGGCGSRALGRAAGHRGQGQCYQRCLHS